MTRLLRFTRFTLFSFRDLTLTAGPVLVIVAALLWGAWVLIDPTPPRTVILATGPANGAYDTFGQRYRAALKREGIDVVLQPSTGSFENFGLLKDPAGKVQLAFVQSGTTDEAETERMGLVSLGSLFVEPVWIFYRQAAVRGVRATAHDQRSQPNRPSRTNRPNQQPQLNQLSQLRGLRVDLGPEGSGVPRLMRQMLAANRVEPADLRLSYLDTTSAVVALLAGKVDAVVFSSAPDAPMIQMLLQTPGIGLFNFEQAEAYARRFPFLSHVVLPRGIVALERDLPPADVHLIAPTATLVARSDTHPAIRELLVQAAASIHGGTGWFRKAGEFPSAEYTEIPVADEALRYYKSGAPLMQRWLPFWIANVVERMWVVLVSLLALIVPLSRIVPPLYQWRVRSRVYRWYGRLREVEAELAKSEGRDADQVLAELDRIEAALNKLAVPLSYADELYALRGHIQMVRERVTGPIGSVGPATAHESGAAAAAPSATPARAAH